MQERFQLRENIINLTTIILVITTLGLSIWNSAHFSSYVYPVLDGEVEGSFWKRMQEQVEKVDLTGGCIILFTFIVLIIAECYFERTFKQYKDANAHLPLDKSLI